MITILSALCLCLSAILIPCKTEEINKIKNGLAIKIVQEPASQSFFSNNNSPLTNEKVLQPKIKPSNFSGPYFLKSLWGKCYSSSLEKYRFDFCPFDNITQHETDKYWNPFKGIVGYGHLFISNTFASLEGTIISIETKFSMRNFVLSKTGNNDEAYLSSYYLRIWEEWKIENNTFLAMKFSNGDDCGEIDRNAYVYLTCGVKNEILNVTEPSKCQYNLVFASPSICSEDDLLVYPRLNEKHQEKWDQLESEYLAKLITKEGYDTWLNDLFVDAGFYLHPDKKLKKILPNIHNTTVSFEVVKLNNESEFQDLAQCNREYQEIYAELEELKIKLKNCVEI